MDLEILCQEAEIFRAGLAIPNVKCRVVLKNVNSTKKADPTVLDKQIRNFCAANRLPMPKSPLTEENLVAIMDDVFYDFNKTKSALNELRHRNNKLESENWELSKQIDNIGRVLRNEYPDPDYYNY